MISRKVALTFAVGVFAVIVSCGGGASDVTGTDGAAGSTGTMTSSGTIHADVGGSVKLGSAAVVVPDRALGADTKITIHAAAPDSALPDLEAVTGMTYDFGPNGTTFATPVTIALPLVGSVPANKRAQIAWLDTSANAWVFLTTTKDSHDSARLTAQTSHFTLFAVLLVDAGEGTVDAGADVHNQEPQDADVVDPQDADVVDPQDGPQGPAMCGKVRCDCTFISRKTGEPVSLFGKSKVVTFNADFKVREVAVGEDIKIQKVANFAFSCGQWQDEANFPVFTYQAVTVGEDFTIRTVTNFPGLSRPQQ